MKHKKKKVEAVLDHLKTKSLETAKLFDVFFSSYSTSYKAARRILYGGSDFKESKWKLHRELELQKFYSLLNRLKRQGLVEKKGSKIGSMWKITKNGLEKLGLSKLKKVIDYPIVPENQFKIIIFDISEKEKWKRAWLREALQFLGFTLFQKSVWIGKCKIPESFLTDLKDLNLIDCVHILEIRASGTVDINKFL